MLLLTEADRPGQGSDSLDDGVGPPFDHTMADPTGHYLFVDVNEHEVGPDDVANQPEQW